MSVKWSYYNKFEPIEDKYLPAKGEGTTRATQIVTAVCKLVYKWYNDGDVFDNTHHIGGCCNDLSSYANWLYQYTKDSWEILNKIEKCREDDDYEYLLKELADKLFDEEYLAEQDKKEKVGTIYNCDGKFEYDESYNDDEEDDDYWDNYDYD